MKPLTKEQFETIRIWMNAEVGVYLYIKFIDHFGNIQEDPEPKAPEPWQWQLCPKCLGERELPYAAHGGVTAGKLTRECPFCLGEGGLKIPQGVFNFKISPVDDPETFKDMLNEFRKNQSSIIYNANEPNQIESFFTDENKKEYETKMLEKYNTDYNNRFSNEYMNHWFLIGREKAVEETWEILKKMAKQKQQDDENR